MKEQPKISVLVPCLNSARYIRQCMDSILSQTLRELEILCIDAGSTDGTLEILQEYAAADKRVRVILSDKKSYGFQMNLGLATAAGTYIGNVDSDDFIEPDMYEKLYAQTNGGRVEVVKCNHYNYWNQQKDELSEVYCGMLYNTFFSPEDRPEILLHCSVFWDGIYKKDFLLHSRILFRETPGASFQDTSVICKTIICSKCFVLIRDALVHYRLTNPNSSCKTDSKVYIICDELKDVKDFLVLRQEKQAVFEPFFWKKEFDCYYWNYRRINDQYKLEFLHRFREEFLRAAADGKLSRNCFRTFEWHDLQLLLRNPEKLNRIWSKPLAPDNASLFQKISFRFYRLTFLISGFFRCYAEHGWHYTVHRVQKHLNHTAEIL